ncbi:AsmA family [Shimwellia blattae]|nr:AsmA family [Shimwellia blattae]
MNSLRRLLLTLLIALTVIIVALYIAVQTRWGASQLAARISAGQQWHITFDKLSHSWSSPSHLVFSNLSLRKPGQPPLLVAQQVDVGLSARQLTRSGDVNSLQIHNGTLNLPRGGLPSLPLQARRLQLSAMNINATPASGRSWPARSPGG